MIDPAFSSMDADQRHRYLLNFLSTHVAEVTFTKVNGETRTMPCTLMPDVLPPQQLREFRRTRLYNPEVIAVWCLDREAWRSFRVMNITNIEVR